MVDDLGPITEALAAYFRGDVAALDGIPVSVQGGPFQERVWAALREIPPGQPTTYHALAVRLGGEKLARAVGMANATNPIAPIIPCHRLIGSDGHLTGYYWGLDRKRWLLDHERRHAQAPVAASDGYHWGVAPWRPPPLLLGTPHDRALGPDSDLLLRRPAARRSRPPANAVPS